MAMDLKWLLSADDKASPVFDKLKGSATDATKGIEGAFSGALSKFNLFTGAVAGMTALAAGGIFSKVIKETVEWTSEAVALSKSLGITTKEASVLNIALGDVYLSKETMLAGSSRIAKTLKTEEEAFTKLGVATRDQSGHYRSTLDIMTDVNTKLGTLKEGTDRNIAGMSIYGKSWGELSGLIKLNKDVMEEAADKAKKLGLEVGDKQVENNKKYKAALNDLGDVSKALVVRLGGELLPTLVKLGVFLANVAMPLFTGFSYLLKFVGKTVSTVGEYIGLLAYRVVSLGSALGNLLSGNLSAAKQDIANMTAAGEDFNKNVAEKWTNWKDPVVESKAPSGKNQLPTDFGAKADTDAADKKVKIWKDAANRIIDIEKDRIKILLDAEKEYLVKLKSGFADTLKELETFQTGMLGVKAKIDARNKTMADEAAAASRIGENSYDKYYRQQAELQSSMSALEDSPGWTAKTLVEKAEKYNDLIDQAKVYYETVKAGTVENVSQLDAARNFDITRAALEQKINTLSEERSKQLTDQAIKEDEAITKQEKVVTLLENQNLKLEAMKKNLAAITDKDINVNIRINGMEQLNQIQAVMNGGSSTVFNRQQGMSSSDYYQQGDSMFWGDGSYAGPAYARGTDYVPADGPAYLHKGEAVIPAGQNTGGMSFGDVTISLPGVTNQTSAKELARMVMPELQQLAQRYPGRRS